MTAYPLFVIVCTLRIKKSNDSSIADATPRLNQRIRPKSCVVGQVQSKYRHVETLAGVKVRKGVISFVLRGSIGSRLFKNVTHSSFHMLSRRSERAIDHCEMRECVNFLNSSAAGTNRIERYISQSGDARSSHVLLSYIFCDGTGIQGPIVNST